MTNDRFKELADRMRQEAEAMNEATLWTNAAKVVAELPPTPNEVKIENTTSETLLWKRGMAPWQRTKW